MPVLDFIHVLIHLLILCLLSSSYYEVLRIYIAFLFVFQGLFLGSLGAASNKPVLKSLNITHILTVAGSIAPAYPNDFTYKVIDGNLPAPLELKWQNLFVFLMLC